MKAQAIQKWLRSLASPDIAEHSLRYFKTGKGEYGEGDMFLGIRMPVLRGQLKTFGDTPLLEIENLLHSKFHEERLFALLLLVLQMARVAEAEQKRIFDLYLANTQWINNWDLVDCSAPQVVGAYLENKSRKCLYSLVASESLWERRIAVLACFHFIRNTDFDDFLNFAETLLKDKEDLIHKAVGWMLREVGKRDPSVELTFLDKHYRTMPRTMLRYAIEKFPEQLRKAFLNGER
jgi:Predicted DNA alkylation repair enzyme